MMTQIHSSGERVFSRAIGLTPKSIVRKSDPDAITITFECGSELDFRHEQNCCEEVHIEDINGEWNDLIGVPLLVASERWQEFTPPGADIRYAVDVSGTWTFYTFRSIKGSVDVRWCGVSTGYYSERVDVTFTDSAGNVCYDELFLPREFR